VTKLGMAGAGDEVVLQVARDAGAVIITFDHDLGKSMFRRGYTSSSIIFLREDAPVAADDVAALLINCMTQIESLTEHGAIIFVHATRIRARHLPIYE
jgi:predicted nuclease of predicted toxin-antitoxin system